MYNKDISFPPIFLIKSQQLKDNHPFNLVALIKFVVLARRKYKKK